MIQLIEHIVQKVKIDLNRSDIWIVVDNTFMSPYLQNPLLLGNTNIVSFIHILNITTYCEIIIIKLFITLLFILYFINPKTCS